MSDRDETTLTDIETEIEEDNPDGETEASSRREETASSHLPEHLEEGGVDRDQASDAATESNYVEPDESEGICSLKNSTFIWELLTLILGIVVIGFALNFYVFMGPIVNSLTYGGAALVLVIASTLVIAIIPLIEFALFKDSTKAEEITEIISLGLIICIILSGIVLLSLTRFFGGISAEGVETDRDLEAVTYALAVFQQCCSIDNLLPKSCEDTNFRYPCFESTDLLNSYAEDAPCALFEAANLVSSTDPAGCGNQEIVPFIRIFLGYLDDLTSTTGTVAIVFGSLMLFCSLVASWNILELAEQAKEPSRPTRTASEEEEEAEMKLLKQAKDGDRDSHSHHGKRVNRVSDGFAAFHLENGNEAQIDEQKPVSTTESDDISIDSDDLADEEAPAAETTDDEQGYEGSDNDSYHDELQEVQADMKNDVL